MLRFAFGSLCRASDRMFLRAGTSFEAVVQEEYASQRRPGRGQTVVDSMKRPWCDDDVQKTSCHWVLMPGTVPTPNI